MENYYNIIIISDDGRICYFSRKNGGDTINAHTQRYNCVHQNQTNTYVA